MTPATPTAPADRPGAAAGGAQGEQPRRGRVRSALARLASSREQLDAAEEQQRSASLGGTPCARLTDRQRATVCGTLRSVTLRPRAGVPTLEAELFDGSGTLAVIWVGRREIAGITPGRRITVRGLVSCAEGRPVVYNPRYELLAAPSR